jgi:hypothetical protein
MQVQPFFRISMTISDTIGIRNTPSLIATEGLSLWQ